MKQKSKKQSNLRALETPKSVHKEELLSYLDFLRAAVDEDRMDTAIILTNCDDNFEVQAIGEVNEMEIVGLLDTAKLFFQIDNT